MLLTDAGIAQSVEHFTRNEGVESLFQLDRKNTGNPVKSRVSGVFCVLKQLFF